MERKDINSLFISVIHLLKIKIDRLFECFLPIQSIFRDLNYLNTTIKHIFPIQYNNNIILFFIKIIVYEITNPKI